MKKTALSLLFLLCFTVQQTQARAVLSGESLWSMQRLVTQASCDITIRQIDLTAGVYTISTSGVYCLAENITGKIIIDTDNVVLDLNGKTMTNASGNCVEVNGRSRVLIKNGSVIAALNNGVSVLAGSDKVRLKNVTSYDCSTGIDVDSSTNIYIHACELIASSSVGIAFTSVSRAQVSDTIASDSELTGFLLDSSSKSFFTNCHALNTGQGLTDLTANIYGFLSADGSSNIFSECVAQNTLALTVTGLPNVAAGFAFTGTESDSEISKCTSSIIETDASGFAIPYGILLQYSFDLLETVTGGNQGVECQEVSWSPDGAYLATGGASAAPPNDHIQVFSFDRGTGTLTTFTGATQGGGTGVFSVSWSPDGAYLATGGVSTNEIHVFSFNRDSGTLTKIDGANQGAQCASVSWSPDGAYLATAGNQESGDDIQIFSFDRGTETLTTVTGRPQGFSGLDVFWSPDGAYLAAGASTTGVGGDEILVFSFDRAAGELTKTDGQKQGEACDAVAWSPDGAYLATSGEPENLNEFQVFKAFLFPLRNTIVDNTVKSASRSSSLAAGVGISGSSIENLIIGNRSYNNAGFNYQFVANVFDERFTTIPTIAQNLSIKLPPLFYSP